jgi:sirohydrochlorin ferrochelatase
MLGEVAGTAVVVPLLLSRGYHVGSDVPSLAGGALVARPLGPHRLLAMALRARLADAGAPPAATTLLGFAGSKWPAALADVKRQARLLGPGIAATTAQEAAATVERLAAGGRRPVALASYVLTPCRFHERLLAAGADVVGDPLGDHPAVARLVLLRYDEAVWAATRRHRPWALSR